MCSFLVLTTGKGITLRGSFRFYFHRVDKTQRGVTRVVLLLCHIGFNNNNNNNYSDCLALAKESGTTASARSRPVVLHYFKHYLVCLVKLISCLGDSLE